MYQHKTAGAFHRKYFPLLFRLIIVCWLCYKFLQHRFVKLDGCFLCSFPIFTELVGMWISRENFTSHEIRTRRHQIWSRAFYHKTTAPSFISEVWIFKSIQCRADVFIYKLLYCPYFQEQHMPCTEILDIKTTAMLCTVSTERKYVFGLVQTVKIVSIFDTKC